MKLIIVLLVCMSAVVTYSQNVSSTPSSAAMTSTSDITSVSPLKACRQQCYDIYQQLLQIYCPTPSSFYCYTTNYLAIQTNLCYAACNASTINVTHTTTSSPTTLSKNTSSTTRLMSSETTTPSSTTTSSVTATTSTYTPAVLECRLLCYDRYQQLMQTYCAVTYFCWYSSSLAAQTYACYAGCEAITNVTGTTTSSTPTMSSPTTSSSTTTSSVTATSSTYAPAVRECRQLCYARYQQLVQTYCPVTYFCWYGSSLAAQTNACYAACAA